MLWARRRGAPVFDRFLDELYPRFWRRELDIEQPGGAVGPAPDVANRSFAP